MSGTLKRIENRTKQDKINPVFRNKSPTADRYLDKDNYGITVDSVKENWNNLVKSGTGNDVFVRSTAFNALISAIYCGDSEVNNCIKSLVSGDRKILTAAERKVLRIHIRHAANGSEGITLEHNEMIDRLRDPKTRKMAIETCIAALYTGDVETKIKAARVIESAAGFAHLDMRSTVNALHIIGSRCKKSFQYIACALDAISHLKFDNASYSRV